MVKEKRAGRKQQVTVDADDEREILLAQLEGLRASEKRYRELVENATDIIYTHDLAGKCTSVNKVVERVTGYTPTEIMTMNYDQMVAPEYLDTVRRMIESKLNGETVTSYELEIIAKDGRRIPLEVNTQLIFAAGKPIGVQGFARDITKRKRAENALHEKKQQLRLITDSVPALISYVDREHRYLFNNHAYTDWFGKPLDEIQGKHIKGLWGEADYARALPYIEAALAGQPAYHERTVSHRDGIKRDVAISYVPDIGTNGEANGFVVLVHDITESKRIEEALKRSELRYRSLVVATAQVVWRASAEGEPVDMDDWRVLTGQSRREVAGWGWLEALHTDDRARTKAVWSEAIAAKNIYVTECRIRRIDGTYGYYAVRGVPVFTNDGALTEWIGTCTDISKRRVIAEELRAQKQFLRNIIDTDPNLIFVKDREGRYTLVNQATADNSGAAVDDVIGKCDADFNRNEEQVAQFLRDDREVIANEVEKFISEEQTTNARGEVIWLQTVKRPLRSPDGVVHHVLGISSDITQRKKAEEERESLLQLEQQARAAAEEANRLRDEFLATISHELRTPLTAIIGWSRIMQNGKLEEDQARAALETILRNARAQAQLVDDLLDISRIVTGKMMLDVKHLRLAPIIEAAVAAIRPAAEAKNIELRVELETEDKDLEYAAETICGDSNRLQQVIWNLLSNAIKFTPRGGRVKARLEYDSVAARIIVSDTGQGIAPEFLPYVFERFRQADSSTTRKYGGLGLGLAIVRQLIEQHGGTVEVRSAGESQGAAFIVTLPYAINTPNPSADEDASLCANAPLPTMNKSATETSAKAGGALDGLHILIVDDEADARELLQTAFEGHGARVMAVSSADEALATFAVAATLPDVLVSDIGMPGADGYELMRRINTDERLRKIPSIAITAYASAEDRRRALRVGYDLHIAKPIEPMEMIEVVARLCRRS